jgi:adenylate kinase family enzyme
MKLIGLSGYARSGKDTVAGLLCKDHGFTSISFAQPMRAALEALNPYVIDEKGKYPSTLREVISQYGWEGAKTSVYAKDIRRIMQNFGTEVGRAQFGTDFWVDMAMNKINSNIHTVFTDVRFPNEFEAIKRAGGEVWRIVRKDTKPANTHSSETALDGFEFDKYLYNEGTIAELSWAVAHHAG